MSRKMICHYEMLEVDQNADDDIIKKNYRKLALKFHPDKNITNEDEAKVKFQLIQAAYEILSDPQERAWYDKHREQILKGGQSDYSDDSLDVYAYFNSSCYKGFKNDKEGFYTVYRGVFEKIAAEDVEYIDENEFEAIPNFGNSESEFEDVVTFYGYWESYSTKKSYAWLFTHDISEIRERRILKIIDKEHKKIQQKARKERNEEIRSLVMFVKKRDKRMAEYRKMLEEKAEQNRMKSQQNRLDQIKKRSDEIREQQKNSKVHKEHEEQLKKLEKEYFNQYSDSEEEYEEEEDIEDQVDDVQNGIDACDLNSDEESESAYDDELYCVACNKFFNSAKAKTNHDSSKKHKQNMELLKSEMNLDEENFNKSINVENGAIDQDDEHQQEESEAAAPSSSNSKGKKSKKKKGKKNLLNCEEADKSEDEENAVENKVETNLLKTNDSEENEDWASNKKGKKSKSKGVKVRPENFKEVSIPEVVEMSLKVNDKLKNDESDSQEVINRCATCKEIFPSKNKLFLHLKSTKHSIYLGEEKQKTSEKPATKKKR